MRPPTPLDLAYTLALPLFLPALLRKRRHGLRERLGHVGHMLRPDSTPSPQTDQSTRPRLLLHAVSVGEVAALRHLVPLLAPHAHLILSTTTDTGLARARELFADHADIVRYPLDFSHAVRRFLDTVRPDAVALVELELWPQFIAACSRRHIPLAVVNGRLSDRSFAGYRRFRPMLRPLFARLASAAVQDDTYAQRFIEMGTPAERVAITGTMKWDLAPIHHPSSAASPPPDATDRAAAQLAHDLGIDAARPLIVAGSTGPTEEALIHAAWHAAFAHREPARRPQLLVAPRKPERFDDAAAALPGCTRRSARSHAQQAQAGPADLFCLDSLGELSAAYRLATLIIIGRSFNDQGGSDPAEPAGLAKPLIIGPHFDNFRQQVDALRAGRGIHLIHEPFADHLARTLATLIDDRAAADASGNAALAVALAQRGASQRHADLLLSLLAPPPTSR